MTLLLGVFSASGLLLCGLSVPLMRRKVGPNPLYGFRVRRTLENPEVWYAVNAYAAKGLLAVGLATCTAAVALYLVPGMDVGLYGMLMAAVVLGGLAVNLVLSFRFLGKIAGRERTVGQAGEDA